MAAKKIETKEVKEVKEVKAIKEEREVMEYVLKFSDGTVIEGNTKIRAYQPNKGRGFQNSGFQVKVQDGDYSGNIMIIDASKRVYI
jgi:hypothetical protein